MDASLRGHRLKSAPRHSKTGPSGRAYFGPSEPAHHRRRAAQKAKHPNCSCSQEMRTRFSARRSVCYLRLEAACSQEVNRWSDPMVPKGTSFHTSIQPRPRAPLGDDRVNVLCFKPRLRGIESLNRPIPHGFCQKDKRPKVPGGQLFSPAPAGRIRPFKPTPMLQSSYPPLGVLRLAFVSVETNNLHLDTSNTGNLEKTEAIKERK